mmetsp:Transcript_133534/g.386526  ORF Transcript_133534/g.386526 Transcript_133534/m.386526 type:complete len:207 (-) Transcript_133534:806-1426(-)
MCRKRSWAGKCASPGTSSVPSARSSSTAMSHKEMLLSSEATASTVSSEGCQSTEVMGFRCQRKLAMGPAVMCLVSQILKPPSSEPVTNNSATDGLQLRTFTSALCASGTCTADFVRLFSRMSQTRQLRSELQEAKVDSEPAPNFFHCTSSTEPVCPANGASAPTFQPPWTGSQRKILPSLPPDRKRPVSWGLKSKAKPSSLCAALV